MAYTTEDIKRMIDTVNLYSGATGKDVTILGLRDTLERIKGIIPKNITLRVIPEEYNTGCLYDDKILFYADELPPSIEPF